MPNNNNKSKTNAVAPASQTDALEQWVEAARRQREEEDRALRELEEELAENKRREAEERLAEAKRAAEEEKKWRAAEAARLKAEEARRRREQEEEGDNDIEMVPGPSKKRKIDEETVSKQVKKVKTSTKTQGTPGHRPNDDEAAAGLPAV
jgi:hypothetical protein